MQDLIAVLGVERLIIIGSLMLVAIVVTAVVCLPTEYVHRLIERFRGKF